MTAIAVRFCDCILWNRRPCHRRPERGQNRGSTVPQGHCSACAPTQRGYWVRSHWSPSQGACASHQSLAPVLPPACHLLISACVSRYCGAFNHEQTKCCCDTPCNPYTRAYANACHPHHTMAGTPCTIAFPAPPPPPTLPTHTNATSPPPSGSHLLAADHPQAVSMPVPAGKCPSGTWCAHPTQQTHPQTRQLTCRFRGYNGNAWMRKSMQVVFAAPSAPPPEPHTLHPSTSISLHPPHLLAADHPQAVSVSVPAANALQACSAHTPRCRHTRRLRR
jgi:hypothetical protein